VVILVQPPIEDFYLTKKRTIPYGLASIAACIRKKGFDAEILDSLATDKSKTIEYPYEFSFLLPFYGKKDITAFSLFHEFKHFGYSYEYIGTKIREKAPFIVGISSLFTAYCNEALKTAQTIKKFYPHCKIVLGGHHPTIFPEKVLNCPQIDFVLRGEGETSMGLLCEALKTGSDLKKIPGIAFKKNDSFIFLTPPGLQTLTAFLCRPQTLSITIFTKEKTELPPWLFQAGDVPCSVHIVLYLPHHPMHRSDSEKLRM